VLERRPSCDHDAPATASVPTIEHAMSATRARCMHRSYVDIGLTSLLDVTPLRRREA
jgi:hypothetical protein